MPRSLRNILTGLVLFCLSLAIIVISFRTTLAEYVLKQILEAQGARRVVVSVSRLDSRRIEFEQLSLTLLRGSWLLDLSMDGLKVRFALAELLHGRVKDFDLKRLELQQSVSEKPSGREPSTFIDLPDLLAQLTGVWQELLPFDKASIAEIRLSGPDLPPAFAQPLTFSIARTATGVTIDCHSVSHETSAAVKLALDKRSGALTLNAAAQGTGELQVNLTGKDLIGAFSFNPAQLNSLLILFGQKPLTVLNRVDSTKVAGTFTAGLSRWPLLNLQGKVAVENLVSADVTLKGVSLQFDLVADGSDAESPLRNGRLQVTVDQASRAGLALDTIALMLNVETADTGGYRLTENSELRIEKLSSAQGSFTEARLPLSGGFSQLKPGGVLVRLTGEEPWRLAKIKNTDLAVTELEIRPALTLTVQADASRIDFAPKFAFNLHRLISNDIMVPSIALSPFPGASLSVDWAEEFKWILMNNRWRIEVPSIEHGVEHIRLEPIELWFKQLASVGSTINLAGAAKIERIDVATAEGESSLRDVAVDFSLTPNDIKAAGRFLLGPYAQALKFTMQHELENGHCELHLDTVEALALSGKLPLSSLLKPWPFPGDATAGQIGLTLDAVWGTKSGPRVVTDLYLKNVDGYWKETEFKGLSLEHRFTLWPEIVSLGSAQISVALVDVGVPVFNILATLRLQQTAGKQPRVLLVELERGSLDALGSTFTLTPFTYRSDAEDNRIRIESGKLDLAQVIPLFKTEGLAVTGLVNLVLPLDVGKSGVSMSDGTIHHKGPGTIIYRPPDPEALKGAGLPEIVIRALEDFRYDSLDVDMGFQQNGLLTLAIQLKGKSPTSGTERPIHINLNIEQNLLSLLKSLSYSENIDREIEKHIENTKEK